MTKRAKNIVISLIAVGSVVGIAMAVAAIRASKSRDERIAEDYDYVCPPHLVNPDTGECDSSWAITEAECEYAEENGYLDHYQRYGYCE